MSFAARARAGREESGAFVFPPFEGWTKLKSWKFGLSKKKNPMFTLELKITEPGDLRGKIVKERVVISAAADWQFDRFLAYLEDSGIDLNGLNDKDPNYQDIQDSLDYLEDHNQKIKIKLEPQEDDKRFYRLKFLEVQKVGEGTGGPVVVDPDDDEEGAAAPEAEAAPEVAAAAVVEKPAAKVTPATTVVKPAATTTAATGAAKKPWQR